MTRHGGKLLIAAGGPSLKRFLPKVRQAHRKHPLWCVNQVGNYLISKGIKVDTVVFCDPQERMVDIFEPIDTHYLVSSQCHPKVFEKLRGRNVTLWHHWDGNEIEPALNEWGGPWVLLHGGCTAALRCFNLGHHIGFREFDYYGLDSSYEKETTHSYSQPMRDGRWFEVHFDGKPYRTSFQMVTQARDFIRLMETAHEHDSVIKAYGDGLIPAISRKHHKETQWKTSSQLRRQSARA